MPENTPDSRDINPNTVTEQQPHSGVLGYEKKVYNFNENLQEAVEQRNLHVEYDEEGKVIVPDTIGDHIDPTQSERTEVYEPLLAPTTAPENQPKWYQKTATKIAGSVLALTGIVAGGMATAGGDEPNETRNEPVASASPTPGETSPTPSETTPTASLEQTPGVASTSLENANVKVPAELAEKATEPLLAADLSPREAAETWGQYLNVYLLSATMAPDSYDNTQSPESIELGHRIEENLFGTEAMQTENGLDGTDLEKLRGDLGFTLSYVNESGGGDIPNSTATYHREQEILAENPLSDTAYEFDLEVTITNNLSEVDSSSSIEPVITVKQKLVLSVVDGRYVATTFKTVA